MVRIIRRIRSSTVPSVQRLCLWSTFYLNRNFNRHTYGSTSLLVRCRCHLQSWFTLTHDKGYSFSEVYFWSRCHEHGAGVVMGIVGMSCLLCRHTAARCISEESIVTGNRKRFLRNRHYLWVLAWVCCLWHNRPYENPTLDGGWFTQSKYTPLRHCYLDQ